MIFETIALVALLAGSYMDIKDRMIYAFIPYLAIAIGLILHIKYGNIILALTVGLVMLLIGLTLKLIIKWGGADIDFLVMVGVLLPNMLVEYIFAFLMIGASYTTAALMLKRVEVPFIPAMFVSLCVVLVSQLI